MPSTFIEAAAERPRSTERRRGRGDEGAVLVEFALVFPILVFLLFGIFGAGILLNQRLSVTQAGREGARYGSTIPTDQCTPSSTNPSPCSGLNWAQLVQAVTAERSAGELAASNVCVALVAGPGTAPVAKGLNYTTAGGTAPCFVDQSSDTGERVQVLIRLGTKVEGALITVPVTLDTRAITRFEA